MLLLFTFCKKYPAGSKQLKGTGLFLRDGRLFWSITVGILQDSEFKEANVRELRPVLLESTKEITDILPGIRIEYIVDQPLNAVFMMQRSLHKPKKEKAPGSSGSLGLLSEQSPLLLLSNSPYAKKSNERKLKKAGFSPSEIREELQRLQSMQNTGKNPSKAFLSEKLTLRDSIWRAHMAQQVRYDLLLSNAIIYPDDLESRVELLSSPRGTLRLGLAAMPGRSGMEGYGAYASYSHIKLEKGRIEVEPLPEEKLRQTLLLAFVALLFPLELKSVDTQRKFESFKNSQGSWKDYWQKRLNYLKAVASLHRGKSEACKQLCKNKIDYNKLRGIQAYYPSKMRSNILDREAIKFCNCS